MKKLNQLLNIFMSCSVGVLIGHSLFRYIDYMTKPDLYAMQSAPWYTSILLYSGVTLFIIAISLIVKIIIRRKVKSKGAVTLIGKDNKNTFEELG